MTDKALEKLKHQNAIALENFKWEKKKEELSFLEAGQHLRALNQQLWQVPGMAIAVTGGIWYGAISISYDLPKLLAFCFAATVDLITIIVLIRLRSIIQIQINLQNKFNDIQPEENWATSGKGWIVVTCWSSLLALAAILSILAAANIEKIETSKPAQTQTTTNNYLYPQKVEIIEK